jgi:hypothetical protein
VRRAPIARRVASTLWAREMTRQRPGKEWQDSASNPGTFGKLQSLSSALHLLVGVY